MDGDRLDHRGADAEAHVYKDGNLCYRISMNTAANQYIYIPGDGSDEVLVRFEGGARAAYCSAEIDAGAVTGRAFNPEDVACAQWELPLCTDGACP